jgi:hypothetical protein
MANSITTQILANTDRKLVVQYGLASDGTELDQGILVDISDSAYNSSGGKAMTGVAVERVIVSKTDTQIIRIGWAATNLYTFAHASNSASTGVMCDFNYGSEWGGLTKDNITVVSGTAAGSGTPTGDIAASTESMTSSDSFTVLLVMRKIF